MSIETSRAANRSVGQIDFNRWSFGAGSTIILFWFLLSSERIQSFAFEEWGVFFLIALVSWQPMSRWLVSSERWVPAAEVFFLLHIPYFVAPFLRGDPKYAEVADASRLLVGLVILGFISFCWLAYRVRRVDSELSQSRIGYFLNARLGDVWRNQVAWALYLMWGLTAIALQVGWMPNLGTYYQIYRTLVYSAGNIGTFVLAYEFGSDRLTTRAKYVFAASFVSIVIVEMSSGFLIGAALESVLACFAYSFSRKKLPLLSMVICGCLFAFMHLGKGETRQRFWSGEGDASNVLSVMTFWVAASWQQLVNYEGDDTGKASLLDRGNLLSFTSKVVSETPEYLPYLNGATYLQTATIFIPRFLWPDKPRASTPNETLAIHYQIQTRESVDYTAISLGKIAEGWGNFGWIGVLSAGAAMGLLLKIPTVLSAGYSPLHVRFLLAVPFIPMAMKLEECMGPGLHPLIGGLALTAPVLWFIAAPSGKQGTNEVGSQLSHGSRVYS